MLYIHTFCYGENQYWQLFFQRPEIPLKMLSVQVSKDHVIAYTFGRFERDAYSY